MSDQISWCVELTILPGQLDSFLEFTAEMVNDTAKERGVLTHQRFVAADGQTVHVLERYESSDAALRHLRNFRDKFAKGFSSRVTRRRFTVYGMPSAELKAVLDGFGAVYLNPLGDLPYWP